MQSESDRVSSEVSTEESSYDVFVSYARRDNTAGWATAIVDRLREARPTPGAPPLRVFFDTAEIRGMDDWRQRLEGAMRRSRVLLVCLSPRLGRQPLVSPGTPRVPRDAAGTPRPRSRIARGRAAVRHRGR